MVIKKTTTRTYEVDFYPGTWSTPMEKFLNSRMKRGHSTQCFERCFCCGKKLKSEDIPTFITVKGIGNRFACAECTQKDAEESQGGADGVSTVPAVQD